jgi:transposase
VRRRRFSTSQKKIILTAAAAPGATVAEVAHRYDVSRTLIHNWRRQEAVSLLGATVRFTPVQLAAPEPSVVEAPALLSRIEIELAGSARVRLEGPIDEASLRVVLRVLRS